MPTCPNCHRDAPRAEDPVAYPLYPGGRWILVIWYVGCRRCWFVGELRIIPADS